MKYIKLLHKTAMKPIETYEGEFIEEKVARVVENKEPIEDGAPIIYTERKDGRSKTGIQYKNRPLGRGNRGDGSKYQQKNYQNIPRAKKNQVKE